jgi:hypothetical protein
MLHGLAFLSGIQQSGPRGGDKLFSTNWFMGMAQREVGRGSLMFRAMLSLDPATVTKRRYPELFQNRLRSRLTHGSQGDLFEWRKPL